MANDLEKCVCVLRVGGAGQSCSETEKKKDFSSYFEPLHWPISFFFDFGPSLMDEYLEDSITCVMCWNPNK